MKREVFGKCRAFICCAQLQIRPLFCRNPRCTLCGQPLRGGWLEDRKVLARITKEAHEPHSPIDPKD